MVPATSDEEEGVSVLGAEAEETDGAETSGGVGDEHKRVAGVADGEDGCAGECVRDLVGPEREGLSGTTGPRRARDGEARGEVGE